MVKLLQKGGCSCGRSNFISCTLNIPHGISMILFVLEFRMKNSILHHLRMREQAVALGLSNIPQM